MCVCMYIWQSFLFMNKTLCNNAVAKGQDMAWRKYKGNCVCVFKYIGQSFLFMNETLCNNAVAMGQDMAWMKI